jgi:Cdc6-like AAA superfamily ATPase
MNEGTQKLVEMALSVTARKAIELGFDKITSVLNKVQANLSTPQFEIEKALDDHQGEVLRWAEDISFSETTSRRRLADVFVPLNVYMSKRRNRYEGSDPPEMSLEDALASENSSCIVFGQPGAGKTTAVKHMCQRFFNESNYLSAYQVLIRIELRQINHSTATQVPEFIRRAAGYAASANYLS